MTRGRGAVVGMPLMGGARSAGMPTAISAGLPRGRGAGGGVGGVAGCRVLMPAREIDPQTTKGKY